MTRLGHLFLERNSRLLNIYFTAGYPSLNDTLPVMQALEEAGADIIELGMPYSDPLADGPVIQQSSMVALENGMTIHTLLQQLKDFRKTVSLPVILMGYMNPVLQYGFEKFCQDAAAVGVDGLIIPDLPEYEFETIYGSILAQQGLDFIFLVTPETSIERLKKLDALSSGFLYAVSSSSTTGTDKNMDEVGLYLERLKAMNLRNPIMAGFGIRDKVTFDSACQFANGAIIGSAFVKALAGSANLENTVKTFVAGVR
ncbi:MAG: tryptophan synthase subunit alpha [Chitinophagaceae bacterium]|nr:MAG: tryptophan synthase subunit alpha [Chitinophagaceae bacterium]